MLVLSAIAQTGFRSSHFDACSGGFLSSAHTSLSLCAWVLPCLGLKLWQGDSKCRWRVGASPEEMHGTSLVWEALSQFNIAMTSKCMISRLVLLKKVKTSVGMVILVWQVTCLSSSTLGQCISWPWIEVKYIYTYMPFTAHGLRSTDMEESCVPLSSKTRVMNDLSNSSQNFWNLECFQTRGRLP